MISRMNFGRRRSKRGSPGTAASMRRPSGTSYAVTIKTQPAIPAQTCVLSNAAGSISNANVDTVGVVCTTNQYSVIVNTAGLAGSGLVLQNNGSEDLAIGANGNSTFATKVNSGATYAVTIEFFHRHLQPEAP